MLAMTLHVSSSLSQVGVLSKQAGLGTEAFFDWATRKFGYLYKIWILPTGTLSVTLDLDNFATARRLSKLIFFSLSWIDKSGLSERDKLDRRRSNNTCDDTDGYSLSR